MRCFAALLALAAFFPVDALAQQVTITAVCSELPGNTPEDVAGAEYTPGVDVQGKPVAPADIGQTLQAVKYPLQIPLELDVISLLDLEMPAGIQGAAEMRAVPAFVTLYEDGRVEYNGRDISNQLSVVCADSLPPVLGEGEAPAAVPAKPETSSGQSAPEPVVSQPEAASASPQPKAAQGQIESKTEGPVKDEQEQ